MNPEDLIWSINLLKNIDKIISSLGKKGKSFRTRCRTIPVMVVKDGLPLTLLNLYAKVGNDKWIKISQAIDSDNKKTIRELKKEKIEEDELAAGLLLYYIYKVLTEKLGLRLESSNGDRDMILDAILHISEDINSYVYSKLMGPYLLVAKRFSESYYEPGE